MNSKKRSILEFAKCLIFILLPLVFINMYHLYDTYSNSKMSNFEYNNILFPIIIRAIIVCLFTVLLLELGKKIRHMIICPIVIVMHFIVYALFSVYPSYFMYTEVLSGLLLVAIIITIDYIRKLKTDL